MVSRLKGLYFRWSWFPNCTWYMYLAKFQQNPWGSGGKFLKFRWFHMEWPYKKQVNNFVFSFLRSPLKLVSSNFYILPTERISNFDSPFSKLCSFKRVVSIGCFWLFMKIKERSKTSFRCTFPAYFSIKMFFVCLILYQLTKSQYQTYFPSQDIKQSGCFWILV